MSAESELFGSVAGAAQLFGAGGTLFLVGKVLFKFWRTRHAPPAPDVETPADSAREAKWEARYKKIRTAQKHERKRVAKLLENFGVSETVVDST